MNNTRSSFTTLVAGLISSLWALNASAGPSAETIANGRLAPCPGSPNCVSSQATDPGHLIAGLSLAGDIATQHTTLLSVLAGMPRTEVKEKTANYIWVTFTTRVMRYVDDVEFLLAEGKPVEVRSASRVGHSDLGTNRRRVESIRAALENTPGK